MKNNIVIEKASDLVTSREQTRTGFIEAALSKVGLLRLVDKAKGDAAGISQYGLRRGKLH